MNKKAIILAVKAFVAYWLMSTILFIVFGFILYPSSSTNPWLAQVFVALLIFFALYLALFFLKHSKQELNVKKKGLIYTSAAAVLLRAFGFSGAETSIEVIIFGFVIALVAIFLVYTIINRQISNVEPPKQQPQQ